MVSTVKMNIVKISEKFFENLPKSPKVEKRYNDFY